VILAVTGGTGFVGREVLGVLRSLGLEFRALVRPGRRPPSSEGISWVTGSLEDPRSLKRLCAGADAVIHLAAAMGSCDASTLTRVNREGTRRLLAAATAAGARRLVLVSSIAARRLPGGPYGESKRAAEALVRRCAMEWVIVRPPLVYGPDSQVQRTLGALSRWPVIPVIGGRAPLYPVHVTDVARACVEAARRDGLSGEVFDLAGPDAVSMAGFSRRALQAMDHSGRLLPIPPGVARRAAAVMERLGIPAPLTREGVDGVVAGTPVDPGPARRRLGFAPVGLAEGLRAGAAGER